MQAAPAPTYLTLPPSLAAQGLVLRDWREDADYQGMAIVFNASNKADRLDKETTGENLRGMFAGMQDFVPLRDICLVEHSSGAVGYAEFRIRQTTDKKYPYRIRINILPEWRERGIEDELLGIGEERLRLRVNPALSNVTHWFELSVPESAPWRKRFAESNGYSAARHFANMVCSRQQGLPNAGLPPGIETRPVKPEHLRRIWQATSESFSENWSQNTADENDYQNFLSTPYWNFDLWQVAWDGDQIVGIVMNYEEALENEKHNYKRGYTENISVRKPWRGRGIAKALLVKSMKMFRDMGFDHTALGVDIENATGAFRLYESVGYVQVRSTAIYRKQIIL